MTETIIRNPSITDLRHHDVLDAKLIVSHGRNSGATIWDRLATVVEVDYSDSTVLLGFALSDTTLDPCWVDFRSLIVSELVREEI